MPAAFPSSLPTIPTAPLTARMRDALRAIGSAVETPLEPRSRVDVITAISGG